MRRLFLRLLVGVQLAVLLSVGLTAFLVVRDLGARRVQIMRFVMDGNLAYVQSQLAGSSGHERTARFERARAALRVPVKLLREAPPALRSELATQGELVTHHWQGTMYHRLLADTGEVLSFGPVPRLVRYDTELLVLFVLGVLLIVTVAALVLGLPIIRDLRAVHAAVERFGQGDLSRRAQVNGPGAIADLASGFNHMADRVARMVEAQAQLFQAVSHELRTPNARIRFTLDLLEQAHTPDERSLHVASIDEDLTEVDNLIDELLLYLRFDTDAPPLACESFEAKELVLALVERARALGFTVDIEVVGESAELFASSKYFRRAIDNLLTNAVRHARGRIRVHVEQSEGGVCVAIEDDGPGVPQAERERIFEPFRADEESRQKKLGGTGLGLAIVQRITARHGGWVRLGETELGGARFTTFWPARAPHSQSSKR